MFSGVYPPSPARPLASLNARSMGVAIGSRLREGIAAPLSLDCFFYIPPVEIVVGTTNGEEGDQSTALAADEAALMYGLLEDDEGGFGIAVDDAALDDDDAPELAPEEEPEEEDSDEAEVELVAADLDEAPVEAAEEPAEEAVEEPGEEPGEEPSEDSPDVLEALVDAAEEALEPEAPELDADIAAAALAAPDDEASDPVTVAAEPEEEAATSLADEPAEELATEANDAAAEDTATREEPTEEQTEELGAANDAPPADEPEEAEEDAPALKAAEEPDSDAAIEAEAEDGPDDTPALAAAEDAAEDTSEDELEDEELAGAIIIADALEDMMEIDEAETAAEAAVTEDAADDEEDVIIAAGASEEPDEPEEPAESTTASATPDDDDDYADEYELPAPDRPDDVMEAFAAGDADDLPDNAGGSAFDDVTESELLAAAGDVLGNLRGHPGFVIEREEGFAFTNDDDEEYRAAASRPPVPRWEQAEELET